jgi:hypothetical protein
MPGALQGFGAALQSAGQSVGNYYDLQRQERDKETLLRQQALENAMRERQMDQSAYQFEQNQGLQERQLTQQQEQFDRQRADAAANRSLTILQNTEPGPMGEDVAQGFLKQDPQFGALFGASRSVPGVVPQAPDFMGPPAPSGQTEAVRDFRGFSPPGYRSAVEGIEQRALRDAMNYQRQLGTLQNASERNDIMQQRLLLENQRLQAEVADRQKRQQFEQDMVNLRRSFPTPDFMTPEDQQRFLQEAQAVQERYYPSGAVTGGTSDFNVQLPRPPFPGPLNAPPRANIKSGTIR